MSSPAPAAGARVALASRVTGAAGDRWSDWLDDLAVDITAMAYPINCDFALLIIN